MKWIEVKNYDEVSREAAGLIISQVEQNPESVLGLATGGTVIGTYEYLVDDFQNNGTSYQRVSTFNLDEYCGVDPSNPHSYHYYMNEKLFMHIDVSGQHIHIPSGKADNPEEESRVYEKLIEEVGGIDLQLLGIGTNGHIGFNEPGTPFDSVTHVEDLAESTRRANARFFDSLEDVPKRAITMGIATIMKSKKIVLLASGESKADILYKLKYGEVTEEMPASILKTHDNVIVIADEKAMTKINNREKRR
ncbi:glucosamine-6-phosphate deaminase [Bacillus marinisedimentorum]|uniref:glucosamine-6-phosphate deaminase n=1 Tax=Bacillus marinisedimentorum TaxID=1821260 RepID=UPI0008727E6D|nr:glucosamine-6-phosphate deaminase [Bacillus marinisedimentorum]